MRQKLRQIKMVLFGVDGVLCRGDIIYLDDGREMKSFDVQDGLGVTLARLGGLKTGIITGRKSTTIERRAGELKVDILSQGYFNKLDPYLEIKKQFALEDHEICFIGVDLLDLVILERAGFSVAVPNAREEVKAVCDYVTIARGGRGAIREVIDLILKRQNKFEELLKSLQNMREK